MQCQERAFRLNRDVHYLNCAYMSPMLRIQGDALNSVVQKCYDPSLIHVEDFFDPVNELRALFSRIVGGTEPDRVAIIPSFSYGVAIVSTNLDLRSDQNIVMVADQFPSNVYAWMELSRKSGAELKFVEKPEDGSTWSDAVLAAIDSNTAVVAIGHVHWADGTIYDLKAIGERARSVNSLLIIDGTQSIGALQFPFDDVQPDALICGGYKWLLGPYSIGAAYFGPWFDDKEPIENNWINRKDSQDFRQLVNYQENYRDGAARFNVGENSNFLLTAVFAAGLKQLLDWGIKNINDYCGQLVNERFSTWENAGFRLNDPSERSPHLFGIGIPGLPDRALLKDLLHKSKVHVSLRGDSIRVSPHVYNSADDIDALDNVLASYLELTASTSLT